MRKRHIIILTVTVLLAGYSLLSFQEALTPYVSVAEARTQTGYLQVKGLLDKQSGMPESRDGKFIFYLQDEAGESVKVIYDGLKPDGFDEAVHIVAVGKYQSGAIIAERLLIKCPSKYQGKEFE